MNELREILNEEVGPRERYSRWVSVEFEAEARSAYQAIGSPKITLDNSWTVFAHMSDSIEARRQNTV